jgi:hypothetical protein
VLGVNGVPRLEHSRVYVLRLNRGAGPVYSSSFNVSAAGSVEAPVPDLDGVERVMVTRERSAVVTAPREMPIRTVETT